MPTYNKLVRDKIPRIIENNGEACKIKRLDQSMYCQELKRKFKEEMNEYLESKNDIEAIEELSDVLEIIHSLSEVHGKEFKDVEATRQQKFSESGGFKERVYLIEVDENK